MQISIVTLRAAAGPDRSDVEYAQQLAGIYVARPGGRYLFEQLSASFRLSIGGHRRVGDRRGEAQQPASRWDGSDDDLPDRGWDAIQERGFTGRDRGVEPNAVSLLEARVVPEYRATGLSIELLKAARRNAIGFGLADLFGPVRLTRKDREPEIPMGTTWPGSVRMGYRRIRGCARMRGSALESSRSARYR